MDSGIKNNKSPIKTNNNNKNNVKNKNKNNGSFIIVFSFIVLITTIVLFNSEIENILLVNSPIFYYNFIYPIKVQTLDKYLVIEKLIKDNLSALQFSSSSSESTLLKSMNHKEFTTIKTFDYTHKDLNESMKISLNNLDNGEWFNFQWGSYVGNQGEITRENGYLRVNSNPYSNSFERSFADHIKFLAVNGNSFTIPTNGSLKVSFNARSKSKNIENHPFGNLVSDIQADFRLASGVLNVLDFKTSIVADFILTNKMIYALYERLPVSKEYYGDYATFIYIVPVLNVENNNDSFNELSIIYSKESNTIEWLVNGKQVLIHDKVGHFLSKNYDQNRILYRGGFEQSVFPDSVNICFGSITLLDATFINSENRSGLVHLDDPSTKYYNPLNLTQELSFYNSESKSSSLLFGQGNIIDIQKITISTNLN